MLLTILYVNLQGVFSFAIMLLLILCCKDPFSRPHLHDFPWDQIIIEFINISAYKLSVHEINLQFHE